MNKLFKILILNILLISGCNLRELDNKKVNQSIDTFNMNIYSNKGIKLFSIKSPFSSYNKLNSNFKLKNSTITIFNENIPEYIINSNNSKLSKNNKLLELNGKVIIKKVLNENAILTTNSFTWNIQNKEYLLVGDVEFENETLRLSSDKAILNKDNDEIEFFNPVKYIIKNSINENKYEINSENAFYNLETKSVRFSSNKKKVRSKIYF